MDENSEIGQGTLMFLDSVHKIRFIQKYTSGMISGSPTSTLKQQIASYDAGIRNVEQISCLVCVQDPLFSEVYCFGDPLPWESI